MYTYYVNGNKVVCVSSYAGKPVRGTAICADGDEFDLTFGKDLARARCDLKVAEKRLRRAAKKCKEVERELYAVATKYVKALEYFDDSEVDLKDVIERLQDLETR